MSEDFCVNYVCEESLIYSFMFFKKGKLGNNSPLHLFFECSSEG